MKVFVSWSGTMSQQIAALFHKYLPCMLQNLEVFMSKHDIESGVRWASTLAGELEQTDFGILCLTPSNLSSDWLLFEGGALSKKIEGRACGVLSGGLTATSVTGPLAQFQHRPFEKDELRHLLSDLNAKAQPSLQPSQLDLVFDKWWPDLEKNYAHVLSNADAEAASSPRRDESEMLAEILALTRVVADSVVGRTPALTRDPLLNYIRFLVSKLPVPQRQMLFDIQKLKDSGDDAAAQEKAASAPKLVEAMLAAGWARRDKDGRILIPKIINDLV
ncbi:MAG: hypothetical protein ABIJ15_07545 [bacterium]